MLGETGILHQHDPRHVDVLVESLGLENGNTVKTPSVGDVKDENPVWVNQISCGQMLVPQSRRSRHNIRRERVVPKKVRSFAKQLFQIEATRLILEVRDHESKFSNSGT